METIKLKNSNETKESAPLNLSKDIGADVDLLMTLVPDKMAFKIGEVAQMLGLKNHILRYWETEFEGLRPKKAQNNQRMYSRKEIEKLLLIRKLLYVDKFSISGARKALRNWQKERRGGEKTVNKKSYFSMLEDLKLLKEKVQFLKEKL